jgi:hypothetical protein
MFIILRNKHGIYRTRKSEENIRNEQNANHTLLTSSRLPLWFVWISALAFLDSFSTIHVGVGGERSTQMKKCECGAVSKVKRQASWYKAGFCNRERVFFASVIGMKLAHIILACFQTTMSSLRTRFQPEVNSPPPL